ncbi:putative choline transporter, neither null mutation nor overexpression affects choline transport, partial [Nowakowskiella sp. JEL0078]
MPQGYYPPPSNGYVPPYQPPDAYQTQPYCGSQQQPQTYQYQQDPYAQQQQSYYPPSPPHPNSQLSSANKFEKNPKFKDLWATILFLIHLVGYGFVAYLGIAEVIAQSKDTNGAFGGKASTERSNGSQVAIDSRGLWITLVASVVVSALFSLIYYFCMTRFTGKMIHVTYFIAVGIFGIIAVMLRTVCSIIRKYPGMLGVAICGLLISIVFDALWFAVFLGIFMKYNYHGAASYSPGAFYGIVVFLVFSLYWTTQVIYNTIHVTISGVFATYYFLGTSAAGGEVTVPVNNPVTSSAGRALTTSFGSICFGSLIIAILQTIRFIIRSLANQSAEDGNFFAFFCLTCIGCLLQMIENLVEYFNTYAFAQVAIYGKDFITAAKDTWILVKSHGVDAIINDNLISNVLFVGSMICGLICGIIGFVYLSISGINPNTASGTWAIIIIGCVLIGLTEFGVLNTIITSGVVTTFVC